MIVQFPAVATQHPRWNLFSVSISVVGVDRRPNDVCERGMVSYIRIIASHLLGPNSLWDIIKKLHLASVLRPPPAKPSHRLYWQCEPSATIVGRGTSKQNNDTWVVAHGTNLRIRSRLVVGAGVAGRARLRSAWQQRCGCARLNQLGWVRRSFAPGHTNGESLARDSQENARNRGWQAYWNAIPFKI